MAASPGSGGSPALSGSNNNNTQNLLSFISLALEEFHSFDLGFTLLSVVLTEDTFHQRSTAAEGGSIRIVICEYDALLEARRLRQDQMHIIPQTSSSPETVALKIPVLRAPYSSDRNRELWTLMAKELRILRHSSIASHPNIVNLLGVSWTAANLDPSLLLPVLVLEATQLGDMREFCREGRRLYPRKWLGLGVDVTSGLAALHDAGVFHGDLKPENVLIFEGPDLAYTVKLADFGSAIFLADMRAPVRTTFATQFWAAPETSESLTGDQLLKADIYSLGLLLWDMLPGGAIQYGNALIRLGALPSISGTIEEMKASGQPLGSIASRILRLYWNGIYGMSQDDSSEDSDDGSDQSKESLGVIGRQIGALIGAAVRDTLEDPAERTASARQVLEELTNALHFACKGDLLHAIHNPGLQPLPVFDSREHEALLHPPWNRKSTLHVRKVINADTTRRIVAEESRVASGEGSSSQAGENSTVLRNVASQGPNDNQGTADQQRSTLNTPL